MEELSGRVAVVTGAASGMGRAVAVRAAREEMRVVVADVDERGLTETTAMVESEGAEVMGVVTDVGSEASVAQLAERAIERFGAVHLVHNNAGVLTGGYCWEKTVDDWRWVLDVNLWGVIHGVRTFVPLLLEQGEGGHVVNTASIGGLSAGALLAPYTVSKFGVVCLTESLRNELEMIGSDIGVSCLCPGEVATGIFRSERNRGEAYADTSGAKSADPSAAGFHDRIAASIDEGMDPARIGELVIEAVKENRFWVFPHKDFKPRVEARTRSILDETNPRWPA